MLLVWKASDTSHHLGDKRQILASLVLENHVLYSNNLKKETLCRTHSQLIAYHCCGSFLPTTTLDKVWLSSKFHSVFCVDDKILKINCASRP